MHLYYTVCYYDRMFIILMLVLLGLCLGSFVNTLVWRLHEQEEGHRKSKGHTPEKALSIMQGRSMCPECKHQLSWRDLVPVISWLSLGGKCRYCKKPISWQYPVVELATAVLFVFSYIFWPFPFEGAGLVQFLCWLIFLTGFMALVIYDLRWFLLPNRIVYPLILLALIQVLVISFIFDGGLRALTEGVWGILIASGLFYILFQISKGQWIGGGDVKLGVVLGLLVGGPLMSWLLIFVASLIGTLVSLPLIMTGRRKRSTPIPFGPMLILAAILVQLFGTAFMRWARLHYLV